MSAFAEALESLETIAVMMAQELQDLCDEAEECGSPLPAVQMLVDDWERTYTEFENAKQEALSS